MGAINPLVVDVSRYQTIGSFGPAYEAGIRGVIAKATESLTYSDAPYATYRKLAKEAGLLWGAYHFFRPTDVAAQVDHFLKIADPDADTLLALDHEDDRVSADRAKQFLELIEQRVGRKAVLYSGNTIKEQLGDKVEPYLASHRLWLAQYSRSWTVQKSWQKPWLWQYTGDGNGLPPHSVAGIGTNIDISHYEGTAEQLAAEWSGSATPAQIPSPPASVAMRSDYSIEEIQHALNAAAFGPLTEDDKIGPRTRCAIMSAIKKAAA